jgi:hypothetical protein
MRRTAPGDKGTDDKHLMKHVMHQTTAKANMDVLTAFKAKFKSYEA